MLLLLRLRFAEQTTAGRKGSGEYLLGKHEVMGKLEQGITFGELTMLIHRMCTKRCEVECDC